MNDQVKNYLDKIIQDVDSALVGISPRGNKKTLKTSKPKHGVYAYVWRMARFHAGIDTTMPITATWSLKSQINADLGYSISLDEENEIAKALDPLVDQCLIRLNLSQYAGALRWKGLIY